MVKSAIAQRPVATTGALAFSTDFSVLSPGHYLEISVTGLSDVRGRLCQELLRPTTHLHIQTFYYLY